MEDFGGAAFRHKMHLKQVGISLINGLRLLIKQELAEIEDRVEHLMKDNQDLKNENVELKAGAAGLKKQMAQADEQHKTLKDKYAKAKNNNQNLKLQLENVT